MDVITAHNKKREYDFVFVCESKVRELESCCLIGQELKNRGYSVGIINWWMPQIFKDYEPVCAKVLMSHAVYKNESLYRELAYIKGPTRVINMQWEQIYSRRELTSQLSPWKMEGDVKQVMHLSWGNNNYNKLIEYDQVPEENIRIVGSVTMDFLRPELRGYYFSRDEICDKYNITNDDKICLFISSFSLVNLPDNFQEEEFSDIWNLQVESQKSVVEWIERLLADRKDITFVYRPHPAEANNKLLFDIEKKYDNFRIIRELSVKQWIVISDIIYNWFSTSIAEIFFAGKSCHILRPIPIPEDIECTILENGSYITKYEDFMDSVNEESPEFPIRIENIMNSYYYDASTPAFIRIADVCESVIKTDNNLLCGGKMYDEKERKLYSFKKTLIGKFLLGIKHSMVDRIGKETEIDRRNSEYEKYVREMFVNNEFSQTEVDEILNKLMVQK